MAGENEYRTFRATRKLPAMSRAGKAQPLYETLIISYEVVLAAMRRRRQDGTARNLVLVKYQVIRYLVRNEVF
jgi:hypothetical protein